MERVPDEIKESDCQYTSELVCPYCGHKSECSYEYANDMGTADCGECGKKFAYVREVEITYNTSKVCTCGHGAGYHVWTGENVPRGRCRCHKTEYGMRPGNDIPIPLSVECSCKEFESI